MLTCVNDQNDKIQKCTLLVQEKGEQRKSTGWILDFFKDLIPFIYLSIYFFVSTFVICLLRATPQHMEVPRLGVQLDL